MPIASALPYSEWVNTEAVRIQAPFDDLNDDRFDAGALTRVFAYTAEERRLILAALARGTIPTGSMGDDTGLAVLSDPPRRLTRYFHQMFAQVTNPPTVRNVTVRYAQLQTLGSQGLTVEAPPALNVFQYKSGLPSSTQWNGGLQMTLPWAIALDFEYVGQHSWNTTQGVNLNAIDFGTAFLTQYQDTTLAPSATPSSAKTKHATGTENFL